MFPITSSAGDAAMSSLPSARTLFIIMSVFWNLQLPSCSTNRSFYIICVKYKRQSTYHSSNNFRSGLRTLMCTRELSTGISTYYSMNDSPINKNLFLKAVRMTSSWVLTCFQDASHPQNSTEDSSPPEKEPDRSTERMVIHVLMTIIIIKLRPLTENLVKFEKEQPSPLSLHHIIIVECIYSAFFMCVCVCLSLYTLLCRSITLCHSLYTIYCIKQFKQIPDIFCTDHRILRCCW